MMQSTRLCLLAISLLGTALAGAGESPLLTNEDAAEATENAYYRWIDANGRIQYTDFEPVGIPAQRISLAPADLPDDAPMLAPADPGFRSDPFHDQEAQILPIGHIGPCADARQQLAVLHTEVPVYRDEQGLYRPAWRGDGYRGARAYLDAEARTAAIGAARAAVLRQCSDPEAFAEEVKAFEEAVRQP